MSGRNRRAKRKIAQLVRMELTRMRMVAACAEFYDKPTRFFYGAMVPLGKRLTRMGLKARAKLALLRAGSTLK